MHRQNPNTQQQNQLQEYAVNQDQHQLQQQQHHQQQISQQRISRTEHTVSRQVTQQRGQWKENSFHIEFFSATGSTPNSRAYVDYVIVCGKKNPIKLKEYECE